MGLVTFDTHLKGQRATTAQPTFALPTILSQLTKLKVAGKTTRPAR